MSRGETAGAKAERLTEKARKAVGAAHEAVKAASGEPESVMTPEQDAAAKDAMETLVREASEAIEKAFTRINSAEVAGAPNVNKAVSDEALRIAILICTDGFGGGVADALGFLAQAHKMEKAGNTIAGVIQV